ncbi:MAG: hypothetical protein K2Q18_04860 [Bdellovibrionales bacterium]|nr:hypothetical protein [Bdellovibrionales bacterium]
MKNRLPKSFTTLGLAALILSIPTVGRTAVYEASRPFLSSDEALYSEWVQKVVHSDIFSNPESPYYGIKTDCADAAFALRTIYAFENKLAVDFIDNEGLKVSEKTSRFDYLPITGTKRLKAFIEFLGENIGSEVLAKDNTYPIDLKAIRPGDLYVTMWKNPKGEMTRHVYIIKDVLITGDLLLYSSTQPRAVRPFLPRKGMPSKIFTQEPFGFKRFQAQLGVKKETLPNYSLMQYEALKLGEAGFFSLVKESLKTSEDTLGQNIQRRIENICVALNTRKDIVESALDAKRDLGVACFKKDQYDELSTPSRDKNINQDIERLRYGYNSMVKNGLDGSLDENVKLGLDYLVGANTSDEGLQAIKGLCSVAVEINPEKRIIFNMKSFYERSKAGLVSSNPNDHLESRWGLEKSKKLCPDL